MTNNKPTSWKTYLMNLGGFRLYMFVLFLIMFVAYDLQVVRLGYYYDDWEGVFLYKIGLSGQQIWNYFLIDRPFSALLHILFNPILGGNPIAWHLLVLVLNWMAILFFVRTLLQIWPKEIFSIAWMGLLLAIYPGISRQFVPQTSVPHYSSMLLFMLSLWLMVLAYVNAKQRWWLSTLSILLGFLQILFVEFFVGLELIRLGLLFCLIHQEEKKFLRSFKRALIAWLPYFAIIVLFGIYKFFLLPNIQINGNQPKHALIFLQQLTKSPISTLINYLNMVLQDLVFGIFYAWMLPIIPDSIELQSKAYIASWLLGFLTSFFAFIAIKLWTEQAGNDETNDHAPNYVWLIAILALLLGGLPGWAIGRQAIRGIWSSRFFFGQVLGIVPFVVIGIMAIVGRNRKSIQHAVLMCLLVSAVSYQFRIQNDYAKDWANQRNFFWQLKWRIPGLVPGAFLVSPGSATQLTVDYQMAFAVNVLYAPGYQNNIMPTWWFNGNGELRSVKEGETDSDRKVGRTFRTIGFNSNMGMAVPIISNLSRGCLLVASREYQYAPLLTENEKKMFLTTHPEWVLPVETSKIPTDVFGNEPEYTWCAYFLKADLAREQNQWDQVINLWELANKQGFIPGYGPEYLPFIEGFVQTGNFQKAYELTRDANQATEDMQPFICDNWKRILSETPGIDQGEIFLNKIVKEFKCGE